MQVGFKRAREGYQVNECLEQPGKIVKRAGQGLVGESMDRVGREGF